MYIYIYMPVTARAAMCGVHASGRDGPEEPRSSKPGARGMTAARKKTSAASLRGN